jgi:hypothetical protein
MFMKSKLMIGPYRLFLLRKLKKANLQLPCKFSHLILNILLLWMKILESLFLAWDKRIGRLQAK